MIVVEILQYNSWTRPFPCDHAPLSCQALYIVFLNRIIKQNAFKVINELTTFIVTVDPFKFLQNEKLFIRVKKTISYSYFPKDSSS